MKTEHASLPIHTVLSRTFYDAATNKENWLVNQFCRSTKEYVLMARDVIPVNQRVYFYYVDEHPIAFLWTAIQPNETGGITLRVHALYVKKEILPADSKKITTTFEKILTSMARDRKASEIGFYTRRNPEAFIRRLNRTSPSWRRWTLDSYVITRRP